MREIKFRVWDKELKEMCSVTDIQLWINYVHYSRKDSDIGKGNYPADVILMQYTGLKDKNGTEIYEGDIVVYYNHKTALVEIDLKDMDHHRVYWEEDECGVNHPMQYRETGKVIKYKSTNPVSIDPIFGMNIHLPHRHAWYNHEDNGVLLRVEVIGNIYDNPELLKTGK